MSAEAAATFAENMAGMEAFNSSINNTGAQLQDWMVQFQSTNDISGIQDRAFTRALSATGTTDLFTKAMHQSGQAQKDTLAQIGVIMSQYAAEHRSMAGSRNADTRAMMTVIGNFGRDVNPTTARAGKGVDKTAAGIEGTMAEFDKAAAAVNNAINDLAVSGFVKFKDQLGAGATAVQEFASLISGASRGLLQYMLGPDTTDTTTPGAPGLPATIQSYLDQLFPSEQVTRPDEGGGNEITPASYSATSGMNMQDWASSLASTDRAYLQSRMSADQNRQLASVSANLGNFSATQGGNDIAGGIATSFERNPAAGARIGSSIGMGIMSYLNFDNIRTAIFGATPVTDINRAQTTEGNTADNRNSIIVDTLVQQAQVDRSEIQRQNMNMNTQLELMLSQLGMLNTNITDQTVALKNALGRSSNNVYT